LGNGLIARWTGFRPGCSGTGTRQFQRSEEGGEKRIGEWIDSQVDWLQTWLFRYGY
jgi:hypothetical protein